MKIEEDVCSIVPASEWTGLSLRLILHGRRMCIANKPRCHECVLADICPSAELGLAKPGKRLATPRSEGSLNSRGMLRGPIVSQSIHGEVATPPQPGTMLASQ